MATDLAEFLGAALGFQLLFGIALFPAAVITAITTFLILGLQRFGFRPLEAVIAAFVAVIGPCYVAELFYANPPLGTGRCTPRSAAVRGQRVAAARGRDPRRDRDATRDLSPLGADCRTASFPRTTSRRSGSSATRGSTS